MCTLIALHRCVPDAWLLVAANRDEALDRPAEGPALRQLGPAWFVAPLDGQAGGTWLGLSGSGVFAALTNRPALRRDASRRSRGHVVVDALTAQSATLAAERLERLPARRYNPFNLLVADATAAFAVVYEDAPKVFHLRPGVHVIGNADPDSRAVPKLARLRAGAERAASSPAELRLGALADLCRGHDGEGSPLDDACVHTPRYGTRSSTLLQLSFDPARSVWMHADGPPCRTDYQDHTLLLHSLRVAAGGVAGEPAARTAP